ncbi:MAG: HD domain-containing protein [Lachnospiraceae bacterium]|nr:HD domain-containing protein [Lachnospiraceae bacterium]
MGYQGDIDKILDVGIALSKEKDRIKLLDMILDIGMEISNCDGGTLYVRSGDSLQFRVMKTISMGVDKGKNGEVIELPPVPIKEENICAYTLIHKKVLNIKDVYTSKEFDFSGPLRYDSVTGYRTRSMLTIPLLNQEDEAVGVLQLLNAMDEKGNVVAFDEGLEHVILALASQAAIAVSNIRYLEEIKDQMWSFTEAMAEAIDSRTPYNANHVRNVAVYAGKIADYINRLYEQGKETEYFDANRREQLVLSALLHDLGKMVIPTKVMNKATKLEDKLEDIEKRFECFLLKYKVRYLEGGITEEEFEHREAQIKEVWQLVQEVNASGFLPDEIRETLMKAFELEYQDGEEKIPYFTKEEQEALLIRKGTLTEAERIIMESHVEVTERILSKVHFHGNFSDAARFAVEHHECLNGMGYPKKLTGNQLALESRILAVADICDALLATDRPYKKPLPREKAFAILYDMAEFGRIDKKIVEYLDACI